MTFSEKYSLSVKRTGKQINGEYVENAPKSLQSKRAIALPASIVTMLHAQRRAVLAEQLAHAGWRDEDRVFPGVDGAPCSANAIRLTLTRGLARAGLPYVRIHDLRHSAASGALMAGSSLHDVKELLGHSNISLTADLYGHVSDAGRRATAARIEGALGAAVAAQSARVDTR